MVEVQAHTAGYSADLVQAGSAAPRGEPQDVSVAGVLLLSAAAVVIAILCVVMLGGTVMGAYWLISHVPVPTALKHLWALL